MLELLYEAAIEVAVAGEVEEHSEFLRRGYGTATAEVIVILETLEERLKGVAVKPEEGLKATRVPAEVLD